MGELCMDKYGSEIHDSYPSSSKVFDMVDGKLVRKVPLPTFSEQKQALITSFTRGGRKRSAHPSQNILEQWVSKKPWKAAGKVVTMKAHTTSIMRMEKCIDGISENEIKMAWQTLEKYEPASRSAATPDRPCSLTLKDKDGKIHSHFIGGARIGRVTQYFVVSDEFIPQARQGRDRDDAFGRKWIDEMDPNVVTDITKEAKEKMRNQVINWRHQFITRIKVSATAAGFLKWEGMNGQNRQETLDEGWLKENFFHDKVFYDGLYSQANVDGDWMDVPVGARNFDGGDEGYMPPSVGTQVYCHFRADPHCAFGNMANLLHYLGDVQHATHVQSVMHQGGEALLNETTFKNLGKHKYSQYHVVMQYMREEFGYQFAKLPAVYNVGDKIPAEQHAIYFIPAVLVMATSHVIAILDDTIIDGAHSHTMPVSDKNLDWCCGTGNQYAGVRLGCYVKIPKKILKAIRK